MNQRFLEDLSEKFTDLDILQNEPLSRHTTFRIGGPADCFVSPDERQLPGIIQLARDYQVPYTVIGNGSNLLVGDKGIRGLVIEIGRNMESVEIEDKRLKIGAGTILGRAAQIAAEAALGGMEFAAGIPGSLGGAVVMNAGAYGGEMKDILVSARVLTSRGEILELDRDQLDLSYRHSCICDKNYIVISATVELESKAQEEIRALMADLRDRRIDKQPLEYPSAGSTFKRPEAFFAGKLIQDAGLRGYSVGGAQVSEKHCGFVINRENATAADVLQLIRDVQDRVYEKFQVRLEPEVKMIGDF